MPKQFDSAAFSMFLLFIFFQIYSKQVFSRTAYGLQRISSAIFRKKTSLIIRIIYFDLPVTFDLSYIYSYQSQDVSICTCTSCYMVKEVYNLVLALLRGTKKFLENCIIQRKSRKLADQTIFERPDERQGDLQRLDKSDKNVFDKQSSYEWY